MISVVLRLLFFYFFLRLFAVKTDRKEDRRKRDIKEQERRVHIVILLRYGFCFRGVATFKESERVKYTKKQKL